jgi:hypothetical protein
MKSLTAVIVLILMSGCAGVPDTRSCLVSLDGRCLAYDFGGSSMSALHGGRACP